MGVDVILYVTGDITDEQMATAEKYVNARTDLGYARDPYLKKDGELTLARTNCYHDRDDVVEFRTLSRYYGPGYERGDWPSIFGAIMVMGAAFLGYPVYYGGDTSDFGDLVTAEFLAGMWGHLLGEDGDAYHARWEAISAEWRSKQ